MKVELKNCQILLTQPRFIQKNEVESIFHFKGFLSHFHMCFVLIVEWYSDHRNTIYKVGNVGLN